MRFAGSPAYTRARPDRDASGRARVLPAPLEIVALSSFGGYLFGLGGYLVGSLRAAWAQVLLVASFLLLGVWGAVSLPGEARVPSC